jgi:DNA-binding NarL/FixJ family response regulator
VTAAAAGTPIRVLVADDQKVVRDGLSVILGLLPGIEVVGAAVDGDDAFRQALAMAPDVVLMDLHMPNCDGFEAIRRLALARPRISVVVLTTYSDDASVLAALRAGARGFLTKDAGAAEIREAVSVVSAGGAPLDPAVQRQLVEAIARGDRLGLAGERSGPAGETRGQEASPASPVSPASPAPDGLTPREVEVLAEIASGLSNAEIARKFRLSDTTVKTHVNHLLAKTAMRDRAQLVAYAFRLGLVR